MNGIDIFAWIVLLVIIGSAIVVFVVLGLLPAKVANARNHPQKEAIAIASWLALLFGFAAWPLVLVWAYFKPADRQNVHQRLNQLELHVAQNQQSGE